jgi:hypothetical protein
VAKTTRDDLKDLTAAVRRHQLAADDITLLREKIAHIRALQLEGQIQKTAQRNLAIADTQLRDIQARIETGAIDEAAFAKLPDRLKKQVLTRLDNTVARMRKALDRSQARGYDTPSFRCMEDYETCKAKSPGSPIWCHIAMVVCQVRALTSVISAMKGAPPPKK